MTMKKEWLNPELKELDVKATKAIDPTNVPVPPADATCWRWPTKVGPKPHNVNEYWECESVGQANGNDPAIPRCPYLKGHDICVCGEGGTIIS
mgnify:CR=1 FL=1